MSLTDKEIKYFSDQLPEGMAVVDFRDIKDREDFVDKYCPKDFNTKEVPYSIKIVKAIEVFIKQVKNK